MLGPVIIPLKLSCEMNMKTWNIYCSGEIHSNWRKLLVSMAKTEQLSIEFTSPNCNHDESDAVGDTLEPTCEVPPHYMGENDKKYFFRDHKSAKINQTRIQTLIKDCDFGVVTFGIGGVLDFYRQWNVAFEAGCLHANNKPFIMVHPEKLLHPLKEIDAHAIAWCQDYKQAMSVIKSICLK